eukprot:10499642-Ditylum_brightwellii.AAC.1
MNLNIPHYQVAKEERKLYRKKLCDHLRKHPPTEIIFYSCKEDIVQSNFLTVINNMSLCLTLLALKENFDQAATKEVINTYKQNSSTECQCRNRHVDKGFCSGKNQGYSLDFMGISIPKIYGFKTSTSEEHMQFCNIAKAALLKAMKAWLPTKAKGKEELLYNIPSFNQKNVDHMNFSFHSS